MGINHVRGLNNIGIIILREIKNIVEDLKVWGLYLRVNLFVFQEFLTKNITAD